VSFSRLRAIQLLALLVGIAALVCPSAHADGSKGQCRKFSTNERTSVTDKTPLIAEGADKAPNCDEETDSKGHNFFGRWLALADRVQAEQPDWLSPLVTTSGRLKQEFRYDIWDQPLASGNRGYQFGGNKGFEFITSSRTQLLVGIPTYNAVFPNGPPGGFGDLPLILKVRIASAEPSEGNYLLTFLLSATAPTGSHRYGSNAGVLTPTIALGKGWKRFDVQSTVGISLPTGDTTKLGRQVLWNTAFQYRARWKLWPELEANSTFYKTGKYAGNAQLFLTPGVGLGRAHFAGRFRFSSAAGMQIATTPFHTYDHRLVLSTRVSF